MSKKKTGADIFSAAQPAAANFAAENRKKKRKPQDHLEYDVIQAEALGYGCHYGAYKADHPETLEKFEAETGVVQVKKVDTDRKERKCPQCGATFYTKGLAGYKIYCCDECRQQASAERERERAKVQKGICQWCGGQLPNRSRTTCCCPECYGAAKRAKARARRHAKNGV